MSKCPFCTNKIESLVVWDDVKMRDVYSYNKVADYLVVNRTFDAISKILKFRCPRCAEVLFYSPVIAEEFLRNG